MPGASARSETGAPRPGRPSSARRACSKLAADGPEIREERLVERRAKVLRAVPAGAGPRADRALDHLHVVVAPLHDPLVEVDEALGHLGRLAVVAVRLDQSRLHAFGLLRG